MLLHSYRLISLSGQWLDPVSNWPVLVRVVAWQVVLGAKGVRGFSLKESTSTMFRTPRRLRTETTIYELAILATDGRVSEQLLRKDTSTNWPSFDDYNA